MENVLKKIILILVGLIILVIGIKYIPFGVKKARLGASLISIDVPKLSSLDDECCEYEATFKTIRSKYIIEKELDKIMANYKQVSCNGKKYYYDNENNITYTNYEVTDGVIFNTYKLTYVRNNICE